MAEVDLALQTTAAYEAPTSCSKASSSSLSNEAKGLLEAWEALATGAEDGSVVGIGVGEPTAAAADDFFFDFP